MSIMKALKPISRHAAACETKPSAVERQIMSPKLECLAVLPGEISREYDHRNFLKKFEGPSKLLGMCSIAFSGMALGMCAVVPCECQDVGNCQCHRVCTCMSVCTCDKVGYGTSTSAGSSGKVSSGWCFVATAVFESETAPEVVKLRHFRDNVLLRHYLGKKFISFYYQFGPTMAQNLENKPFLKKMIKSILKIIVN